MGQDQFEAKLCPSIIVNLLLFKYNFVEIGHREAPYLFKDFRIIILHKSLN